MLLQSFQIKIVLFYSEFPACPSGIKENNSLEKKITNKWLKKFFFINLNICSQTVLSVFISEQLCSAYLHTSAHTQICEYIWMCPLVISSDVQDKAEMLLMFCCCCCLSSSVMSTSKRQASPKHVRLVCIHMNKGHFCMQDILCVLTLLIWKASPTLCFHTSQSMCGGWCVIFGLCYQCSFYPEA